MGGSVKVVIREKDGKVTKMDRWTNNLNWWFQRPEFIRNPHKIIKEYIKKKDESGYYTPRATLAPDGYGLIVIDAVNKVILTHQDYCDFGSTYGARFALDLKIYETLNWKLVDSEIPFINLSKFCIEVEENNKVFAPMGLSNDVDEELATMKRSYELFMMGAVVASKRILTNLEENEKKKVLKSKSLRNYRELYKKLGSKKKRTLADWEFFLRYIKDSRNFSYFDIHTGFKVIDFDTGSGTLKEYQSFKEKLLDLGFNISKRDEADWTEYLSGYAED